MSVEKKHSIKSCFHGDKGFWPIFPFTIECDKPQETICEGPQANLTITAELTRAFLRVLTGCWKHKFLKKKQPFQ